MKYLNKPATDREDDKVVYQVCKAAQFEPHRPSWIGAYCTYRKNGGDPWKTSPLGLGSQLESLQYDLYDSRKSGGPIRRIRRTKGLLYCPMCGSPTTGDVDHYLPRAVYPEFSIMRSNLVPACTHCNSGSKGAKYKDESAPGRFIHPYFDVWADESLWLVEYIRPLAAVDFRATELGNLSNEQRAVVRFHLKNVLGDQFARSMGNMWGAFPIELAHRTTNSSLCTAIAAIELELRVSEKSTGVNSWRSSFLRGLLQDEEAAAYQHHLMLQLLLL